MSTDAHQETSDSERLSGAVLVLPGAGTRVAYQAGVVQAMDALGVDYSAVVASSSGVLTLAALLSGVSGESLAGRWRQMPGTALSHRRLAIPGMASLVLYDAERLDELVLPRLGIDTDRIRDQKQLSGFLIQMDSCGQSQVVTHDVLTRAQIINACRMPVMASADEPTSAFTGSRLLADVPLMAAVERGATTVYLPWVRGDGVGHAARVSDRYTRFLDQLTITTLRAQLSEVASVNRAIDRGESPYGLTEHVVVHVIAPQHALAPDLDHARGRVGADVLLDEAYRDTCRCLLHERSVRDTRQAMVAQSHVAQSGVKHAQVEQPQVRQSHVAHTGFTQSRGEQSGIRQSRAEQSHVEHADVEQAPSNDAPAEEARAEESLSAHAHDAVPSLGGRSLPRGILFREAMRGRISFGATDPVAGYRNVNGIPVTLRGTIRVPDTVDFVADPQHRGELIGHLSSPRLLNLPTGSAMPAAASNFQLFSPTDDPTHHEMIYELGVRIQQEDYWFSGRKAIRRGAPWKLWRDTTTLQVRLHRGNDTSGEVVASGILRLGVMGFLKLLLSLRGSPGAGLPTTLRSVGRFGRFFATQLWRTYGLG